MKKRKYVYLVILCIVVMFLCMSSGGMVSAEEHPEGVTLIRFNLHKSLNKEVGAPAGVPGYLTYYYAGKEYHYGFRFDKNGEGLESKVFGTAYVWTPYSVIHYDALKGKLPADEVEKERAQASTAYLGNVALRNTRGDGAKLEYKGNSKERTGRYGTDYTIYGNSLELSEGVMPVPVREGYRFEGWYIETKNGVVKSDKTKELAKEGNFKELQKRLNTEVTGSTKILEDLNREDKPAAEITLYAKWKKEA